MNMNVGGGKLWRLKGEDEYGKRMWKEEWSEYMKYKKELISVSWSSDMQN